MALKVSGFSGTAIDYKIVEFDNSNTPTSAIQENVTGTSGAWYSITCAVTGGSPVYVRLWDGSTPTLGTDPPTWTFRVKNGETERVEVPGGVSFTQLNLATTNASTALDTAAPTACTVTIVCS